MCTTDLKTFRILRRMNGQQSPARKAAFSLGVVAAAVAVGAGAAASQAPAGPQIQVRLKEMAVQVSAKSVPAGKVTFVVRNAGTVEHEMVVIRRDAGALPVHAFRASEAGAVDEVAELGPGKSGRLTVELKPGRYLLVCNIVGHYQLGMSTVLKVAQND